MIHAEARKPQVVRIDPDHLTGARAKANPPLRADESYFRLSISDIWLSHDFEWGSSVHAGVQSLVRIQAGGETKTVPAVAGPQTFDLDSRERRGVATRTQFLTQALPFRGGTIDTQIALLRIPGEDYLKSFMNVLGSFSELVGAPPLSTALKVATKVTDGLSAFAELGQATLHAGLQEAFTAQGTANELRPGYVAVIRTDGESVLANDLWIGQEGDLRTGPRGRDPYTQYDYMVLHYETSRIRDDWAAIPEIDGPLDAARTQAKLGKTTKAKQLVDAAIEAVMVSDDLVNEQKDRIVETLREIVRPPRPKSKPGGARGAKGAAKPTTRSPRIRAFPDRHELTRLAAAREM